MGLFDKLTGKAQREAAAEEARLQAEEAERKKQAAAERKAKREAKKAEQAAKAVKKAENPDKLAATEKGEPWVSIVSVELDPENIGNGAFELDWNDKFIANLVRAGYQAEESEAENIIVDRWFQTVCRNILAENFEQWAANQTGGRQVSTEDLGDGKTSVS